MKQLRITPILFTDYLPPQGFLPRELAAHACWYYYVCCEATHAIVGKSTDDQIVLEGEPWHDKHYDNQRMAITMVYDLESPNEIDRFWPAVRLQARALGLPEPRAEYMQSRKHRN